MIGLTHFPPPIVVYCSPHNACTSRFLHHPSDAVLRTRGAYNATPLTYDRRTIIRFSIQHRTHARCNTFAPSGVTARSNSYTPRARCSNNYWPDIRQAMRPSGCTPIRGKGKKCGELARKWGKKRRDPMTEGLKGARTKCCGAGLAVSKCMVWANFLIFFVT